MIVQALLSLQSFVDKLGMVALLGGLSNTLWPYYADFIAGLVNLDAGQIRQHSIADQLMHDVINDSMGVSVH